jgi:hypothetical protein
VNNNPATTTQADESVRSWKFVDGRLEPYEAFWSSDDWEGALKTWGFGTIPMSQYGNENSTFWMQIYRPFVGGSTPSIPFKYIVEQNMGDFIEHVFVPDYPSLLQLLSMSLPLVVAAQQLFTLDWYQPRDEEERQRGKKKP